MQQSPHVEDGEIPVYSIDGPPLIYASTDFKTLSRTARELRQLKINSTPFTTTASASNHSNDEMNFLKTGQWSPDGSCFLTTSNDDILRLYDVPHFSPDAITNWTPLREKLISESIYSSCWYPMMNAQDPSSCCVILSTRDNPIKLVDIDKFETRCTYMTQDHVEQIKAPSSLSFNLDGSKIYAGFENRFQVFDTSRPGRDGSINVQTTPTRKSKEGQKGIISCISFNPDRSGLFAIGSFSGSFGLYDANNNDPVLLIRDKAAVGSVTQVQFSLDGHRLFLAARQSDHIDCWDIRNMGEKLYSLYRLRGGRTNQRIGFSLDTTGNVLATGDLDGSVRYFDVSSSGSSSRSSSTIAANDSNDARLMAHVENTHADCVAVASFHPSMAVLATGSGQRRYHHELDQTMLKLASSSSSSTSTSLEDLDKSTSYECSVKAHAFQYKAV